MQNMDVFTIDGDKVGHVVAEHDDYLILEHGLLHHKHALPRTFVEEADGALRTTLSKQLIHDSPKVSDDFESDRQEVAEHYGLAEGYTDPPTRGRGDLVADDPAFGAGDNVEERVAIREGLDGNAKSDEAHSAGLLGGDRFRDAPKA
jgi:hypothetical protein